MWWRAAAIVLAGVAALAPIPRAWVETFYAGGAFPILQFLLTTISNQTGFALFDALLLAVLAAWIGCAVRDVLSGRTSGWAKALAKVIVRTLTIGAIAYLAFLITWGFNYRRIPLLEKLDFDASRISPDAALALADQSVERLNALYDPAHAAGWADAGVVDPLLAEAFSKAVRDLDAWSAVPARPKRSLLDLYFLRAGVAGMTDPYFLETLVASDLLPFERPFVVAHEWSHLAGLADEGDANFAGWLACLRGTASHQYSAWLFLYSEVVPGLDVEHARIESERLAAGPREDLLAIRQRIEQHVNAQVARAGWQVYDRYLKANSVQAGTASYAEVVRLVLGTRFQSDWRPILR